jgi:PilZ domain
MDFLLKIKQVVNILGGEEVDLPAERRDSIRIVVPIEGSCRTQDGTVSAAVISDIGLHGMRLEVPRPMVVGLPLEVTADRDQGVLALAQFEHATVTTEVLWCRKASTARHYVVGVRYHEKRAVLLGSWLAYVFQKFGINIGASTQRRKDVRIRSHVPCLLAELAGDTVAAEAINMGIGGLLLSTSSAVPEQTRVVLEIGPYKRLPLLRAQGIVVRRKLSRKGSQWLLGVAFHSLAYEDSALLTRYLLKLMRETEALEPSQALM